MSDSINKQDVMNIISEEKTNSLRNHFLTFFNRNRNIVGEIKPDTIFLWKTNMWISGSFPIFKFEFNESSELINITTTRNLFAKYTRFMIFIPILFLVVLSLITIDFSFASLVLPLILVFIFIGLYFVTKHIYEFEKKQLLIELYNRLDIEYDEEKPKEFTLKKFITRITIYPLSVFLIVVCSFIINDAPIYALIGMILPSVYIITDILILLKRNKK